MTTKEVELNIPSGQKGEPFFYNITKSFEVITNIVEASFSTTTGWAIVKFSGEDQELVKLFKFLEKKGVQIKFR